MPFYFLYICQVNISLLDQNHAKADEMAAKVAASLLNFTDSSLGRLMLMTISPLFWAKDGMFCFRIHYLKFRA
jgi:hypothetical protein